MKKFRFTAAVTALILAFCVFAVPALALSKGDLDGDGVIKSKDIRIILRAAADIITLSDEERDAADVNNDGLVRANDARMALRIAAGLEEMPGAEEPTVPEEPTEPEEPVTPVEPGKKGNADAVKYYEKFYIDANIVENGSPDTGIVYATDGKELYISFSVDGNDMAILIKSELLGGRSMNIINKKTNEYLSISQSLLNTFGMIAGESISIDEVVDDAMGELDIIVPYLTSYEAADLPETEIDGAVYGYYDLEKDDGTTTRMFFRKGETSIARLDYITSEGETVSSMTFNKVGSDPSSYLKIPSGCKKITFSLTNIDKVMEFMEGVGM